MEDKKSIRELKFDVHGEMEFKQDVRELSDEQLIGWHDMMHVFFKELEKGIVYTLDFKWDFNQVIVKHSEIVHEMLMRNIPHYHPINNLDLVNSNIIPKGNQQDSPNLTELSKKENKVNLSFESPKNVETKKED